MKIIFGLCGVILLTGSAWIWWAMRMPSTFGQFTTAPKVEAMELLTNPVKYTKDPVTVEGTITEQCQSMGCFFSFHVGDGKSLRVDLQQIAMTAPMREGHRARVQGVMVPFNEGYELFATAIEFQ